MTSNKEDYLKTIYDAGGFKEFVSNKVISDKLGVSPASVSEMAVKLQHDGLIDYKAYHGSKLTQKGIDTCTEILRSHRLWEVFLIRHLGYSWWEAHKEADLLEHSGSARMIDSLDDFLGHPDTCPHGSPIPKKGKSMSEIKVPTKKLSDLEIGQKARIVQVAEDHKLLDYLEKSGIHVVGDSVLVVSKDDYDGPISLEQEGRIITISFKAASQIMIKIIK